jgi:exopolyphosphatase/guanosine-5'-triphosphate,3'-diphosphate pyrophosphatase
MESLYMGCVSYTQRFFPDGKITKAALQEAELTARSELQSVSAAFGTGNWQEAIGSSGTARALADIMQQSGWSHGEITQEGLQRVRSAMLKAGNAKAVALPGLQADRIAVLPGGFAVMAAVFDELGIERMAVAEGALREGVLYDLVGRVHHHDQRDATVNQFMRRYHVDTAQAARVERLALALYAQVGEALGADHEAARQMLSWAARLHEVGWSIAHAGYHKHSAYILANSDMPGFAKTEQVRLALLVRAHRGSLAKLTRDQAIDERDWEWIAILRLAALLCRSRRDADIAPLHYSRAGSVMRVEIEPHWLAENPLTETLLAQEQKEWKSIQQFHEAVAGFGAHFVNAMQVVAAGSKQHERFLLRVSCLG